jgi:hypothetical protein
MRKKRRGKKKRRKKTCGRKGEGGHTPRPENVVLAEIAGGYQGKNHSCIAKIDFLLILVPYLY